MACDIAVFKLTADCIAALCSLQYLKLHVYLSVTIAHMLCHIMSQQEFIK